MNRLCVVVVVAALALAGVAHAAPGAVLVGGSAPEQEQRVAVESVTKTVNAAGWALGTTTHSAATFAAAEKCLDEQRTAWSCVTALLRGQTLRHVAVVTLRPAPGKDGATDTIISERLIISDIDSLFVGQRTCERCTHDKLRELVAGLTKHLLSRAAARSGRTAITVTSVPTGATVEIDSVRVGATDFSTNVAPGTYRVTLQLAGYRAETRHVIVQENTTEPVSITLQPEVPGPADPPAGVRDPPIVGPQPARSRWRTTLVPAGLVTIGGAALVGGVVQFARDEDAVTEPGQPVPPRFRDTGTQGVVLAISGAVVATAGVVWWRLARSRAVPVVAPTTRGAVVGLTYSF